MRVLILGGTAEARSLAAALVEQGHQVTSSLAGRVRNPRLPVGDVRIGGFGGVTGLAAWLRDQGIDVLVDATHPYATTMSEHAVTASERAGVPLVRFVRPGWSARPDAAAWNWVDDYPQARERADRLGTRPFITTGRQTLEHYLPVWGQRDALVRVVEPLNADLAVKWTVVTDRGPYSVEAERTLMLEHKIDVLLTKDSGGSYTSAKLDAAAQLEIPVVVVRRPQTSRPTGPAVAVHNTQEATAAIESLSSS